MTRRKRESVFADALLDGKAEGAGALASVLAAARADRPHDMAGLDAAMTAFTATGPVAPVPYTTAAPAISRTVAGRSVVVRAVVLAAGGMLVGGAAVAAVVNSTEDVPAHHPRPAVHSGTSSNQVVSPPIGNVVASHTPSVPRRGEKAARSRPAKAHTPAPASPTSGVSGGRGHPTHPAHTTLSPSSTPSRGRSQSQTQSHNAQTPGHKTS